jgi:hypothetical protein
MGAEVAAVGRKGLVIATVVQVIVRMLVVASVEVAEMVLVLMPVVSHAVKMLRVLQVLRVLQALLVAQAVFVAPDLLADFEE